jgi:hypothetical protein
MKINFKNIYFRIPVIFAFSMVLLISCSDCPITQSKVDVCEVREGTITQFNPGLTIQYIQNGTKTDTVLVPVPEYSIHTFEFPADRTSSGNLPNDMRFEKNDKISIIDETFSFLGVTYKAVVFDKFPANNIMQGDILVDSIFYNPPNSYAYIRVAGYITSMPTPFMSEDADQFCRNYMPLYKESDYNSFRSRISLYGKTLANASSPVYSASDVKVVDNNNNVISGVNPDNTIINSLLGRLSSNAVHILVKPGEVYFYRARNGKEFAVVIADIKQGTFVPNKKSFKIFFTMV